MIGDIRILVTAPHFAPFSIHMADGRSFRVPTRDHVGVSTARATVMHDDGSCDILPGLLMAGLTVDAPGNSSEAE